MEEESSLTNLAGSGGLNRRLGCFFVSYIHLRTSLLHLLVYKRIPLQSLIDERSGGEDSGYSASGFWAGITLGRLVLPRFGVWFGERRVIFLYIALALVLEVVVWLVKDLVSNAIAVALVGFLIVSL